MHKKFPEEKEEKRKKRPAAKMQKNTPNNDRRG